MRRVVQGRAVNGSPGSRMNKHNNQIWYANRTTEIELGIIATSYFNM